MFLSRARELLRLSAVRQTLVLLALFYLISVLAWGVTYGLIYREMIQSVDARLASRMDEAVAEFRANQGFAPTQDGQSLGWAEDGWPDGFVAINTPEAEGPDFRYFVRSMEFGRIAVGENVERQEELREILAVGMQVALAATLVLTILAGGLLARTGQRRLGQINAGLAQVGQGHLETRISLDGHDDLSLLADRINATVARLEDAMTQMRVQSSNIAHDLRTPLARLRAQIETNLAGLTEKGRPIEARDLEADLEQIDQINEIFDALLRLSRLESGVGRQAFQSVDLGELVRTIADTFEPVVSDAGQKLVWDLRDAATVQGDQSLLIQLVANLIQNALRYGAPAQDILIRVEGRRLSVVDEGPGIPESERGRILQPLIQGESPRQGDGFGLGLAMVRAIANLHEAKLSFDDGPGGRGLSVTVEFAKMTDLSGS
ncbi:MAG: HAMP domain-containing sensor histidine kinase [Pseudomonadota bacterium]